jgi:hypothetical protein
VSERQGRGGRGLDVRQQGRAGAAGQQDRERRRKGNAYPFVVRHRGRAGQAQGQADNLSHYCTQILDYTDYSHYRHDLAGNRLSRLTVVGRWQGGQGKRPGIIGLSVTASGV